MANQNQDPRPNKLQNVYQFLYSRREEGGGEYKYYGCFLLRLVSVSGDPEKVHIQRKWQK